MALELINDMYYSLENAHFYFSNIEEQRIANCQISDSFVERVFHGLAINDFLFNFFIEKGYYEDDIIRWAAMLSLAIRFQGTGTYKNKGYKVKIENKVEAPSFLNDYYLTVNGADCFHLKEVCTANKIDHVIDSMNIRLLEDSITNDWDDTPILNALYPGSLDLY